MNQLNIPETNLKRVVIIGCGFAGLNLAKGLKGQDFQVILIDKHNYHTFQPLLYQVATAGLEPDSIAYPIRNIFKGQPNFFYRMAEAQSVDSKGKVITTNIGDLPYDYLVIATGSNTNYFGMKDVEENSMPMKTVPEALNLRSLMLQNFESASLTNDLLIRERLMNFVIVGGGPTGVELAGALAELKNHVLPNDYPDLDFRRMSIHLVEAADRLLPPMSAKASTNSLEYLKDMGVQVWLNTQVKAYDGETVKTNQKNLESSNMIWAAGVSGKFMKGLAEDSFERGRYLVNGTNQIIGEDSVYVVGDIALMKNQENPKGHPMVAQVAIQQAVHLAKNLKRISKNKEAKDFVYKDLGSMATVGRNKAVADLGKFKVGGFIGWLIWMVIHLVSLVGFRNKLVVLLNWFVNYFSYDRKIRLIIRPFNKDLK